MNQGHVAHRSSAPPRNRSWAVVCGGRPRRLLRRARQQHGGGARLAPATGLLLSRPSFQKALPRDQYQHRFWWRESHRSQTQLVIRTDDVLGSIHGRGLLGGWRRRRKSRSRLRCLILFARELLQHLGVVRAAIAALVIHKVEGSNATLLAVAAKDEAAQTLVLFGHLFTGEQLVDAHKVLRHVAETLAAEWAGEVRLRVCFVALDVDAVAAWQKHDWDCAGEEVFRANWAVALERALHALVVLESDAHASVAPITVKVVDAEAFADAANLALFTVIDLLIVLVVKKFALGAKVSRKALVAVFTFGGHVLFVAAHHAAHLVDFSAVNLVV
mmetsp:Transcript_25502/g.72173  ORF Transcript_25502/g.72173 Transcript_25502/m.72173 type:complete len:330 (+) Transcript_25502:95-1084(+)